jgi:lipopolysaccharide transport system ATP-binding protein
LIGHNGAGKTTLLKMLNGLIKPDSGKITMRGRVGALIALGAGFNPILTGRENIYINGSVLGLSKKEIDGKIDEIIDFAEIGEFIDSPVQNYSSGMTVRLGFAVATAMDPDVLILDEVLAVGDAAFRNKCYQRILSLRKRAAVIFVSHMMEQVARISDYALTLVRGRVACLGSVTDAVAAYEKIHNDPTSQDKAFLSMQSPVQDFKVLDMPAETRSCDPLRIMLQVDSAAKIRQFLLRITIFNASGAVAADCNYSSENNQIAIEPGANLWSIQIASLPLKNGKYIFALNIIDQTGDLLVWSYKNHGIQVTGAYAGAFPDCQLPLGKWECCTNPA